MTRTSSYEVSTWDDSSLYPSPSTTPTQSQHPDNNVYVPEKVAEINNTRVTDIARDEQVHQQAVQKFLNLGMSDLEKYLERNPNDKTAEDLKKYFYNLLSHPGAPEITVQDLMSKLTSITATTHTPMFDKFKAQVEYLKGIPAQLEPFRSNATKLNNEHSKSIDTLNTAKMECKKAYDQAEKIGAHYKEYVDAVSNWKQDDDGVKGKLQQAIEQENQTKIEKAKAETTYTQTGIAAQQANTAYLQARQNVVAQVSMISAPKPATSTVVKPASSWSPSYLLGVISGVLQSIYNKLWTPAPAPAPASATANQTRRDSWSTSTHFYGNKVTPVSVIPEAQRLRSTSAIELALTK